MGRKMEFNYEVTQWDPPNTLGLKSIEESPLFRSVWEFASDGEGGTELTNDTEGEIPGFLKLAEGLVARQFQKQLEADFNALKLLLDGEFE